MSPVALVTGTARGIGAATAQRFVDEGWTVIGVDRDVRPDPVSDHALEADLSDPAAVARITENVLDRGGNLDVLVNNAGIHLSRPLETTDLDDWSEVLDTNLTAAFLLTRNLSDLLARDGGGAVVNVASVHASATTENVAAYAASKGGLTAFTRAAALDLASEGIRVNAVLPGAVDTPMLEAGLERGDGDIGQARADLAEQTPLGRVGEPHEIAESVYFLADGDRSSFITGQTLTVDGGALARLSTE